MKKLMLIALVGLCVISCKKPAEDEPDTLEDYIEGKWFITDLDVLINTDVGPLGTDVKSVDGYYNFKSDKSYDYEIDAMVDVTIPFVGDMEIPYFDKGDGTYRVIADDKVEMTEDGMTSTIDILSSSNSKMIANMETVIDTMGMELTMDIDIIMEK